VRNRAERYGMAMAMDDKSGSFVENKKAKLYGSVYQGLEADLNLITTIRSKSHAKRELNLPI